MPIALPKGTQRDVSKARVLGAAFPAVRERAETEARVRGWLGAAAAEPWGEHGQGGEHCLGLAIPSAC